MGSLNATLLGAANALDVFQYALNISQNNIDNASTPGYAKQSASLESDAFDPSTGLTGGVSQGPMVDARDLLAERDVWEQSAAQGDANARNEALTLVQNALPVSDGSGISAAMSTFFNDVSAWSVSPQDGTTRQAVMDSASSLVDSFHSAAAAVTQASQSTDQAISGTVDQINQLTTQLAQINAGIQNGGQHDAGLHAQLYSTLETLSGLVQINALPQQDGTVCVSLAGGAALVVGPQAYSLTARPATAAGPVIDPDGAPHTDIYAADGTDITSQVTSGTLYGELYARNVSIPGLIGDTTQPGALNQLAQTMALRINQIVSQGSVSAGVPAPTGLFLTDPTHPSTAAANLAMDPQMSASQLPAIDQNGVANGVPLALAALAQPQQVADEINSVSYITFYGNTAAQVGRQLNQAQSDQTLATQTLSQAQTMRQNEQGVSLNEEALQILQFQQAYQATAKLVSTLSSLAQTVIDMIPS